MLLLVSKFFYRIVIASYHYIIGLLSLFNEKAYKFSKGRLNQNIQVFKEKTIWFHCASLGEFEQAKPLINWCYNNYKEPIIITFFSPSGYSYKNNYPLARAVYYLPMDNPKNAKAFIEKINPKLAFFVKYEFWYFFLSELASKEIPHVLVAGIFREEQAFFKSWGALYKKMLHGFTHVFVQDEASQKLLQDNGFTNSSVAFDTRFDTVKKLSEQNYDNDVISEFKGKQQCLVVGSSWLKDEQLIANALNKLGPIKLIIAPHDVTPLRIKQISKLFPSHCLLSNPIDVLEKKVLIIDSIGKLSLLYRFGDLCYIGGGFGVSVHNVLEAAVYGKPLLFGPNHTKSKEAKDLIALGAAQTIQNGKELIRSLNSFQDKDHYKQASSEARNYVMERSGGTETVMKHLKKRKIV